MLETIIYLIRHATPDWDRHDLPYHLPPGPPLTAEGLAEAYALGDFLRQEEGLVLFSSPLERCTQTARIISQATGASTTIDDRLIEWQPEENTDAVRRRAQSVLDFILSEERASLSDGKDVAGMVTHGGPIGVFLELFGMEPAALAAQRRFDHRNPLPPAAAWKASREGVHHPWILELAFVPDITFA